MLENTSLKLQLSELHKITLQLLRQVKQTNRMPKRRHAASTNKIHDLGMTKYEIERLARCFADDDELAQPTSESMGVRCQHLPTTPVVPSCTGSPATSAPVIPILQDSLSDDLWWDDLDFLV